ncbi:FISUMP domain-containing protein [Sphingobacterium ginsenosidimutans]|uniref:Fibrobacter succinogenes major paralogous domain-containing protein n=1 Tax=Sphingobacterium ginsenosidimutans TaxID=687845 RepID=A0ABP8A842_9SPHI
MKNKILNNRINSTMEMGAFLFFVLFALIGCRTKDDHPTVSTEKAVVKVNILGNHYDNQESIEKKSTAGIPATEMSRIQRQEVAFNGEYTLEAELAPASSYEPIGAKASTKASTETKPLDPGIRYKMAVYKSSGEYVTERDYIRGNEGNTLQLSLDGGQSYTFVAYSVNSATDLPPITFANPANKTLVTSSLEGLSGSADLMYYKKDNMVVSGNTVNYVDITLTHKMSMITTIIDASATGYDVTAITASITPHYPTTAIQLSNGTPAQSGQIGNAPIIFQALNAGTVVSAPLILNAITVTGTLNLASITVGPMTQQNIVALNNVVINPGVKYDLRIRINPKDVFLDHQGQKAARINGVVWMRYDLGAPGSTSNIDPDQDPSIMDLYGNFYQWGRIPAIGTANWPGVSSWSSNIVQPDNAWNSGTEIAPVKTATDPCPSGYRIPTKREAESLISGTTASNIGLWAASQTNYSAAKVLTSIRNKNVKLTLPVGGRVQTHDYGGIYAPLGYEQRGQFAYFHTSYTEGNNIYYLQGSSTGMMVNTPGDNNTMNKFQAFPIRCVAE